jgi:hypothetical protein
MDHLKQPSTHPLTQLIIPSDPEKLIALAEKIIGCHQQKGIGSPLKVQLIADLNFKCAQAKMKHAEGTKYKRLMEQAMEERDQFLGLAESQVGISSIITTISFLAEILESKQNKEELTEWGFSTKSPDL